jgi:transposase InsO family protein
VSTDSDAHRQKRFTESAPEQSDPGTTDTKIVFDHSTAQVWSAAIHVSQGGSDGAALLSAGSRNPRWEIIAALPDEGPLVCMPAQPGFATDEPPLVLFPVDSPPPGDRASVGKDAPSVQERRISPRGWDRQEDRRRQERQLRKRSVAFYRYARASGWSAREAARVLGLSSRTLYFWAAGWKADHLALLPRGRPPQIAPDELQTEVKRFLELHGPSVSLSTLRAEHRGIARAELAALRAEYRALWRLEHAEQQCCLEWLHPGSVWAMDFTHPPHLIDGVFPTILNVLDLASHRQLLWLPVGHENAATIVEALADLFEEHGAPLVLKCDNGPAFRAERTQRFLLEREVFTLYSPPYCAQYNGGCERANRTLKELTAHVADQAGRPAFWTSDDLLEARLRANRLNRPWGPTGPTPKESWTARGILSLDKRRNMWQHLKSGIATVLAQREIDSSITLPHYTRTEIERIAAQPVLERLGLLHVTRRRIAPAI